MPSYHIQEVIKKTCRGVAIASVPTAYLPGLDLAVVGGSWAYMINEIAKEHHVTIQGDTGKFVGVLASGIGAYWVGSQIINKVLLGILSLFTFGVAYFVGAPVLNVLLNGYFTWSVGKKCDKIFADTSFSSAGQEIAALIIKAVCHMPTAGEMKDFFSESGLSLKEIKNMVD